MNSVLLFLVAGLQIPNFVSVDNPSGKAVTYASNVAEKGKLSTTGAFFQNFGANLRTCFSCHDPKSGWSLSPPQINALFESTQGLDPIFRTNDGSNSPNADVSSVEARRKAYGILLTKGVLRIGLAMPPNAEFALEKVEDPYGFASAKELSLFRRPLPATNLGFLKDVMWDGRETLASGDLDTMLGNQANTATLTHAATTHDLQDDSKDEIVGFEKPLFTAQAVDAAAGALDDGGARGGPRALSRENGAGAPGFSLFTAWEGATNPRRAAIRHGERLFNDLKCATCHDVPNVGGNSKAERFDIGIASEKSRTPDLPLYTFRNLKTGTLVRLSDPGRGLVTGKWDDLGKFKVPGLRGLASRAPYFHNGAAPTIEAAVRMHDAKLKPEEISDLSAFLAAL